jgi:hypothetical protein
MAGSAALGTTLQALPSSANSSTTHSKSTFGEHGFIDGRGECIITILKKSIRFCLWFDYTMRHAQPMMTEGCYFAGMLLRKVCGVVAMAAHHDSASGRAPVPGRGAACRAPTNRTTTRFPEKPYT